MKFKVVCPTLGRPEHAGRHIMKEHATFVVVPREYDLYAEVLDPEKLVVLPEGIRGATATRQWILENLWADDEDFIMQMDDDVTHVMMMMSRHIQSVKDPEVILDIFTTTGRLALDCGAPIFGYLHTPNPAERPSQQPFAFRGWVDSGVCGIAGRELEYDLNLTCKEDSDMCLQAQSSAARIILMDMRYAFVAPRWKLLGGMTTQRTHGTDDADMEYMQDKWGKGIVQPNPGRRSTGQAVKIITDGKAQVR
jgi:hypothetical protein